MREMEFRDLMSVGRDRRRGLLNTLQSVMCVSDGGMFGETRMRRTNYGIRQGLLAVYPKRARCRSERTRSEYCQRRTELSRVGNGGGWSNERSERTNVRSVVCVLSIESRMQEMG